MKFVGKIAYVLAATRRKRMIKHLTLAFGNAKTDAEIKELAKKATMNLVVCIADAIRSPVLVKSGAIDKIVTVENFHHFTDAHKRGKGVIFMSGHFGNWELLGAWMARQGYPLLVVNKKSYDSRIDKLILEHRQKVGIPTMPRGDANQAVLECLMAGDSLGMLCDLDTRKRIRGVFVNFFGVPAHTITAPIYLASQLDVPIVPVLIRLTPDYNYVVMCQEELKLVNTGDKKADLITNTQTLSDVYEKIIRKYPEQWFWMHRRWRSKPDGTTREKTKHE